MTVKQQLHARIDAMDESEAKATLRLLNDEPLSSEDATAIDAGLAELRDGRVLSGDKVRDLFA